MVICQKYLSKRIANINIKQQYKMYRKYVNILNKNNLGHLKLKFSLHYNWNEEYDRIKQCEFSVLYAHANDITESAINSLYHFKKYIPVELCKINNLSCIRIKDNLIKEIPKKLSKLKHLRINVNGEINEPLIGTTYFLTLDNSEYLIYEFEHKVSDMIDSLYDSLSYNDTQID